MHRKSLMIVITVLCLLAPMTLTSVMAEEDWSAYVFNGNTGELVQVKADGTQAVSALGLDVGTFVSSYDMTFTQDGSRLAFCALTSPAVAQSPMLTRS